MLQDQAKEILPIITAFAGGATIEIRCNGKWEVRKNFTFAGKPEHYRVKPEPLCLFVVLNSMGDRACTTFLQGHAEKELKHLNTVGAFGPYELVEFIQVME